MIKKLLLISLILSHNAYASITESSVPGGIKKNNNSKQNHACC